MNIKIAVAAALAVFFLVIGAIFIANSATQPDTNQLENSSQKESSDSQSAFTNDEVAEHSTRDDCWIIIDDTVYDVTNFISSHPGGAQRIIGQCGKDATTAFETQDGQGSHSSAAHAQLKSFEIGIISPVE